MKSRIFLLLALIFAFLQGALLPFVLAEGFLVTILATYEKDKPKFFTILFLAGVLFDIIQGQTLGASSLIFLIGGVALTSIGLAISHRKSLVLVLSVAGINLARAFFLFSYFSIAETLITIVLALVFFKFFHQPTPVGLKVHV